MNGGHFDVSYSDQYDLHSWYTACWHEEDMLTIFLDVCPCALVCVRLYVCMYVSARRRIPSRMIQCAVRVHVRVSVRACVRTCMCAYVCTRAPMPDVRFFCASFLLLTTHEHLPIYCLSYLPFETIRIVTNKNANFNRDEDLLSILKAEMAQAVALRQLSE